MKKSLLLKYVALQANIQEQEEVMKWAGECKENMEYLASLKLSYIASGIPQERADEREMAAMGRLLAARTEKEHAVRSRNRYRIFSLISAAAAAVAIIAFIFKPDRFTADEMKLQLLQDIKEGRARMEIAGVPQDALQTIYTEKGVKSEIELPDGSIVKLNSDTKIVYPMNFIGSTREVYMSGEAYFKVVGDTLRPMIVTTGKGSRIKVLGTEFNVKSYENDIEEHTTLYSGKITLLSGNGRVEKIMSPEEQAVVDVRENVRIVKPDMLADTKAWTEGRLIFDATPMDEVIKMLERWHGVKIDVKDSKILKYKITANFESESIHQIMYIIKNCSLIDYNIQGNMVSIFPR